MIHQEKNRYYSFVWNPDKDLKTFIDEIGYGGLEIKFMFQEKIIDQLGEEKIYYRIIGIIE